MKPNIKKFIEQLFNGEGLMRLTDHERKVLDTFLKGEGQTEQDSRIVIRCLLEMYEANCKADSYGEVQWFPVSLLASESDWSDLFSTSFR